MKERALRDVEQQLQAVLEMTRGAVFMTSGNSWTIAYANSRMAELVRCAVDDIKGAAFIDFVHPGDREQSRINMHMLVTGETAQVESERRLLRKDGSEFMASLSARALCRKDGTLQGVMVTIHDDSRLQEAEQALNMIQNNYWEIFNATNDAVFVHDAYTGAIVEANQAVAKIYGYSREEVFFLNANDLSSGEPPYSLREAVRYIRKAFEEGPQSYEWLARKKNGQLFWAEVSLTSSHIGGEGRVLAVIRDISDRKEIEKKLQHLSSHDALTGLFNRLYFETEFERIAMAGCYPVSVIVADLDNLKPVNDNYGHEAGDRLIKSAAKVLSSAFRGNDVVARIGGDEFAVLLPMTDEQQVAELVGRIRKAEQQFNRENGAGRLGISIGSATAVSDDEVAGIIGLADKRMYENKQNSRVTSGFFGDFSPSPSNAGKCPAVLTPEPQD